MNRTDAKEIAHTITNEQLLKMFNNAKRDVKDWTIVSTCNKGFTKGVAWNMLAKDFLIGYDYKYVGKVNMIHEFGDYLPEELKIKKKPKEKQKPPVHHNPIFEFPFN